MQVLALLALFLFAVSPGLSAHAADAQTDVDPQSQEGPKVVEEGSRVSIEYTLTLDEGEVADTNVGGEALVYEQGQHQILPALEQELAGLTEGQSKQVTLPPEQGYGVVNPELFQTVPASVVPEDARKVGTQLLAQAPDGQQRPVRVHEIKGEEIVIDLNHPLAGEMLHFDVRILSVE